MGMRQATLLLVVLGFSHLTHAFQLKVEDLFKNVDQAQSKQEKYTYADYERYEAQHMDRLRSVLYWPLAGLVDSLYWNTAITEFSDTYTRDRGQFDQKRADSQSLLEKVKEFYKNLVHLDSKKELKVFLLPSLLTFNGAVVDESDLSEDAGNPVMYLGLDTVIKRKDNLERLISHEMVHLIHFSKQKGSAVYQSLIAPLWIEGLAVYGSELYDQKQNMEELLSDKTLAHHCLQKSSVQKASREFLEVAQIKYEDEENYEEKFSEWFIYSPNKSVQRWGYCLGYHVIKKLSKAHSFSEMLAWPHDEFSQKALQELKGLSSP